MALRRWGARMDAGEGKEGPPRTQQAKTSGKESIHPPTIFFAGFSKLPANASVSYGTGVLMLEVEVDPYDMRIVDAACNCLPALGEKFLVGLLAGNRIDSGIEPAIKAIRTRYFSLTKRAMIAALEDLKKRYDEFCALRGEGGESEKNGLH